MRLFFTLPILLFLSCALMGQQQMCLTVHNDSADLNNGYYYFDVYLNTLSGAAQDLYLATSDFRLEFNTAAFSSPTLEVVLHPSPYLGLQAGYCGLVPATPDNGITDAVLRSTYHNLTATSVTDSVANINLGMPTATAANIGTGIAVIDDSTLKHRLGRFRLTGYTGGNVDLSWRFSGALRTRVFAFDTVAPFSTSETQASDCMMFPLPEEEIAPVLQEAVTRLYPNPSSGKCWLELEVERPEATIFRLFDLSGKQVAAFAWTAQSGEAHEIALQGLTPGLYLYQLSTEKRQKSGKLLLR